MEVSRPAPSKTALAELNPPANSPPSKKGWPLNAVYASAAAPAAKKYPDGIAASPRYGRDSVYSLGKPVRGTPVVADLTERFGRA